MLGTMRNNRANITMKILVITLIIFSLFLGVYLYQISTDEKNNLLYQVSRAKKEKNELTQQLNAILKSIEPLKDEIQALRETVYRGAKKENLESIQQPGYIFDNRQEASFGKAPREIPSSAKPAGGKVKASDTRNSLIRLKDYLTNVEEQNNSLQDKVKQLEGSLEAKAKEIVNVSDENANLKKELEKTVKAQNELKSGLDASLSSQNALKAKLAEKESGLLGFNEKKTDLEKQISALNDKLLALSNDNFFLEKQVAQYLQEKNSLDNGLQKIKEELVKQVTLNDAFNKKVAELKDSLRDKEGENLSIAKELGQLRKSKSDLESELNELKFSKMGDDNQASELNARIKELTSSYDSIRDTVSQLSNFLAKKDAEITDKQNEIYALKGDLDMANKEKEELFLSLRGKEKDIFDLNVKLNNMESQITAFQKEVSLAKDNQRKTIRQLSEVSSINTSLQERLLDISKGLDTVSGREANIDKKKAEELRKKVEVKLDLVEGKAEEETTNYKMEDSEEEILGNNLTSDYNQLY